MTKQTVTKAMLIPATIAAVDRLVELGHTGTPMGYKDLFLAMFPKGAYGTVHNRLIGQALVIWEKSNYKTIDYVLPTLRNRQVKGNWHSVFTTEEQLEWIEKARVAAESNKKRLQKKYGTDRVWARAYLQFTAEDLAQSEFAAV